MQPCQPSEFCDPVTIPWGFCLEEEVEQSKGLHERDQGTATPVLAPVLHINPTPQSQPTAEQVKAFTRQQQPTESTEAPTPFPAEGRR